MHEKRAGRVTEKRVSSTTLFGAMAGFVRRSSATVQRDLARRSSFLEKGEKDIGRCARYDESFLGTAARPGDVESSRPCLPPWRARSVTYSCSGLPAVPRETARETIARERPLGLLERRAVRRPPGGRPAL